MGDSFTRVPITVGRFVVPAVELCEDLSRCDRPADAGCTVERCLGRKNSFADSDPVFERARGLCADSGLDVSQMLWQCIMNCRDCDGTCSHCVRLIELAARPSHDELCALLTPVFTAAYIVACEPTVSHALWGSTSDAKILPTSFTVRNAWFDSGSSPGTGWSMPSVRIEASFELDVLEEAAAHWRSEDGHYERSLLRAWERSHLDYRITDDVEVTMRDDHLDGKPPMLFTAVSLENDVWFGEGST